MSYTEDDVLRWKHRVEKMQAAGERAMKKASAIAEVNGAAFAGGFVRGYFDNPAVMGIPADLLAGVALMGAGLFTDQDWGDHAVNMGSGLTASFSTAMGAQVGAKLKSGGGVSAKGEDPRQLSSGYGNYSGNDAVAEMLRQAHGLDFNRQSF
jgi:hypothetical protein